MEHKKIVTIDSLGNILRAIETNDASLIFPDNEIVIDLTNQENAIKVMLRPELYQAKINEDGIYTITLK